MNNYTTQINYSLLKNTGSKINMTADELKNKRLELGLTQTELGNLLGKSLQAVQAWEYGRNPIPKNVVISIKNIPEPKPTTLEEPRITYGVNIVDEIEKAWNLRQAGALTEEEFAELKKKLLN